MMTILLALQGQVRRKDSSESIRKNWLRRQGVKPIEQRIISLMENIAVNFGQQ